VGAEEVRTLGRLGLRAMIAAAGLALLLNQVRGEGVAGPAWKWVRLSELERGAGPRCGPRERE
jgi:hypothetical protein